MEKIKRGKNGQYYSMAERHIQYWFFTCVGERWFSNGQAKKGRISVLLTLPNETSVLGSGDGRRKVFERKGNESSSSECICMWLYLT